jgi:muramidase (phage lysozyme)
MTRCAISPLEAGCAAVCAVLDTVAWCEGTDNGKQPTRDRGYDVIVGGAQFASYAKHPHVMVHLPKLGINSSAAGRYQLLGGYADTYIRQLKLPDFAPLSQDRIAIQQMRERAALPLIHGGQIEAAFRAVAKTWASLPGAGYGQHEYAMDEVMARYAAALAGRPAWL